jgi:DNA segregation ATPase FtsK/SpoIIIE, S-DNA-T family
MSANSLKNNSSSKKANKSEDFKAEPKITKKANNTPFYKDEKKLKIVGILFFLISIFLLVSLFSYFNTWHLDQDKILGTHSLFDFLFRDKSVMANKAAKLGALASHVLVYKGFGIFSLLLVPFFAGIGYNLFGPKIKFKLFSFIKNGGLLALIGAPLCSFLFSNNSFSYGGAYGNTIVTFLNNIGGTMGTGFILGGIILACIIYIFNPVLKLDSINIFNKNNTADANLPKPSAEDKKLAAAQKEAEALLAKNASYEEREAELYLHHTNDDIQPDPKTLDESANALIPKKAELQIDDTLEITNSNDIENSYNTIIENENSGSLEMDTTYTVNPVETDLSNLSFNVTAKENDTIVADEHTSVEGLDPYDPSLDLRNYKFPTIDLLEDRGTETLSVTKDELEANKNQIIQTLKNFGINIAKISATVGPTVTLYEIVPADGVRISKIRNLEDDIALSLAALGIRIIAPIPGKGTIGIEVPNLKKQIVNMRTLIASEKFVNNNFSLPIAIGKKIDNENFIVDLATMPHLLMAGATGQGKSVGLNAILVSLLYKKHPSQLKFVLVDPKKVELSIYKHIEKHFLAKLPNEDESIITDTKKVVNTLNSLCIEMDQRYDLLKEAGVRNIKEYNEKFVKRRLNPQKGHRYLPFIVLVVDEFADLIMTAGKEVEMPIARLAQLARAIGIHLIIATQRPSVNVITGTIKANFPARIAFRVSAKVDSRTILDAGGAEQLVGKGDLLISNGNELTRVQCAFVDTPEVERIIEFIGDQQGYPSAYDLPEYIGADGDMDAGSKKTLGEIDQMFEQCARLVVTSNSGSTSMLQRRFNLGYNRAGRIMDQIEAAGIVGPTHGGKPRELLIKTEAELEEILRNLF